jgi:glycine/D-amino acid oxidase-like deaminating enzyme
MASACFIKQRFPEKKAIVLEKDFIGYGSSGRNTGISGSTLGHSLLRLTKKFGSEKIKPLQGLASQSFSLVEELVHEHGIDCDYERSGLLIIARNKHDSERLEQEQKACDAVGLKADLLNSADTAARFGAVKATDALRHEAQGMLNPGKFVRGMKRVVESLGVEVYENSRCVQFEPGRQILVHTPGGRIVASDAVIATNAYPDPLGLFQRRVMPFYVYNIVSEPLTPRQLERLEWPGRAIIFNAKHLFWIFRLTADNRLLFIYNDARYFRNTALDYSDRPSEYAKHYRLMLKLVGRANRHDPGLSAEHRAHGRVRQHLLCRRLQRARSRLFSACRKNGCCTDGRRAIGIDTEHAHRPKTAADTFRHAGVFRSQRIEISI